MSASWSNLGPIAWGGSVLSVHTNSIDQTWAATGGGLLARGENGWRPVPDGPAQVGLVAAPGTNWWVAGLTGGLESTYNSGRTWWEPFIDRLNVPITCIAASPHWNIDRIMLAGTAGGGVLRTVDGGRRWLPCNFGLQEFNVLALTPATDWSRREIIFAGTLDGVYRSSGGGRAWKPAGLAGITVQALAASSEFASNGIALAGAEGAGLFRTADGSASWEPAGDDIGRDLSINALVRVADDGAGEAFIAATDLGALWRSDDGGVTWACMHDIGEPVLSLSVAADGMIRVGTSEHGVLTSTDGGRTWQPDESLCAWGFRRLSSLDGKQVYAWAPTGGVWVTDDDGAAWERVAVASHYEPLFAHLRVGGGMLEARTEGLWLVRDDDSTPVLDTGDAPVVALAGGGQQPVVWAADSVGNAAVSRDGGLTWQAVAVPWVGQQFLTLTATEDGTAVVASADAAEGTVTLWRHIVGDWESWLVRPAKWAGAAVAPTGVRGEDCWAVIAGEVWAAGPAGWEQVTLPEGTEPAVALARRGDTCALITGRAVLRRRAGGVWESHGLPGGAAGPVDLSVLASDAVLCLDAAGTLWRLEA